MSRILVEARKISIPTKKEEKKMVSLSDFLLKKVKEEAIKYSDITGVEIGGSYAKGTWLKNEMDLDIFIKFRKETDDQRFEEIGKKIGFSSMRKYNPYVRYSEHPYVEAEIGEIRVNVVPCYDVEKGEWKSAADRSSFHTRFILQNLDQAKKNEVRILKKFLKGRGIYGAEIAKEGFGGYVAEVLIHNYGSFVAVLEAAANFTRGQVIGNPTKKFEDTLVLIDPIDSNRNLGTAISPQNVARFITSSRAFLKRPSLAFFKERKSPLKRKNLKNVLVVRFSYKWRGPDTIWGQIKRGTAAVASQLELAGFHVLRKTSVTDEKSEAAMVFLLGSSTIEKFMIKTGPDIYRRDDSEKFISKNSKNVLTWIDNNGKILSMQERKTNDAKKFLENLLRKKLADSGVPRGIAPDIRKGFQVHKGESVASKSIKKALAELTSTDGLILGTNN